MIQIHSEVIAPPRDDGACDWREQSYTAREGLRRRELSKLERDSDFFNDMRERFSEDNGRSWGPWQNAYQAGFEAIGDDEVQTWSVAAWNPVHGHTVQIRIRRSFLGGHIRAYEHLWGNTGVDYFDHMFVGVGPTEGDIASYQLLRYEDGAEFDPADPLRREFLTRNNGYPTHVTALKNGDIAFAFGPKMDVCCRILGISPEAVFPSCPHLMCGLMIARGVWDAENRRYNFQFSRPVVIGDRFSSRGIDEPLITELENGRLLVVFRGSNVRSEAWRTRIEPGTPAFKWYTYSDDGGRTFSDPAPWHFDNGEVAYSPATISYFFRSSKTGGLYWIGNITGPEAYGNSPRYPLHIAQVDERYGTLLRDTLTVIDTKRETDSPDVQLSNFSLLEDRESGCLELFVAKIGQFGNACWQKCETWKYTIVLA